MMASCHDGEKPRQLAFTGKSASTGFAPNVIIRVTPDRHEAGTLPPVPPAGYAVPIDTMSGVVPAEVLTSARACIVLGLRDTRWIATQLKPSETQGVPAIPRAAARHRVVRVEGKKWKIAV